MIYALVILIAFFLSLLITPVLIPLVKRRGITALPLGVSDTDRAVPMMGGIAVFIAFTVSTSFAFILSRGKLLGEFDINFMGLMIGGTLILLLGIYDDVRGVKAPVKLIVQIIAAAVLVACGFYVPVLTNPFGGQIHVGVWGIPLIILWIVGLTNAINLLDGLDGLACGVTVIAGFILFFSSLDGTPFMPTVIIGLVGACLGFLIYNSYPARIFLGDTGSLFLGFVLAATSIQSSFKTTAGIALVLPLIALLLPIADTAFAFFRRIVDRRHPFAGDQRHLHHRLLALGYSQKQAVNLFYMLTINLGLIGLVMKYAGRTLALGMLFLVGLMLFLFIKIIEDFRFTLKSRQR